MGKNILQTTNKRVRPSWLCPLIKKIFTLLILLLLLPVTALAADTNTVYVGGVELVGSHDNIVYATTNESGEVITNDADADNYNIKWDGNTLTLKGAYITKEVSTPGLSSPVEGAAIGVYNQSGDANLTITLEGTNTIKDVSAAIHVFAPSGSASLTITGDGILSASSGYNPGIRVQSNTGNGTLAITGAKVTASSSYSGNGVQIRCGDSSNASLTVNGGSLTATGSGATFAGIIMQFGSSTSGSGTPTVTVSDNAIVRANGSAGGITSNSSAEVQTAAGTGTVYGDVELQEDITIGEGESLTIGDGASLDTNGKTITVESGGKLKGTIDGKQPPEITVSPVNQTVEEGSPAAFSVTASAGEGEQLTYQWQQKTTDSGSEWMDISDATNATYTTGQTTMAMSGYQYRCVVTASDISVISAPATLTVNAKPTYTITAVSSPAEGGTVTVNGGTSSVSVEANSTVNLVATPNAGYRFTGWTSSGGTIADASSVSTTFTMPANDVIVTAGFEQYYPVTSITLDKSELFLYTGNSETLTATIEPDNATNKNVTWSSDNEAVATVDNGKVTAVKEGTATITVTAQDGSGVSTSCSVTVTHSMVHTPKKDATCTEDGNIEYWYCKNCDMYFSDENATEELSDVVIPATGHHYVNGYCTKCGHRDPDYRPDPISYYNIYVEDVCDGVEVTLSNNVVREGNSISVYVKKDTANYTFDNFKVYYKRSYYGTWNELPEGVQPGEYPIKNIWNHIYIKAEGAEEKEDPTGIEQVEGVKVYTKDGSLYVQTPQREQVIIVSMSGAVVKNEEQVGLKQYHGLQPGIYIVRVGNKAYKLRLN